MDIDERVDKLEKKVEKIEEKVNTAIPEIQSGIREIKALLQERLVQEDLKNDNIKSEMRAEMKSLEDRTKKLEDSRNWTLRTIGAVLISTIIGAIIFVIKMM